MKKFDRLPAEARKDEIKNAAIGLFVDKGFKSTTMENIVEKVSLSKGGVYRIYSSTTEILSDIILDGMHLRNQYYVEKVTDELSKGHSLTINFLVNLVLDSLLIYPEISVVYVEFLWEKRRNHVLEELYQNICKTSVAETYPIIKKYASTEMFKYNGISLELITELMNTAIMGINVLNLRDTFDQHKDIYAAAIIKTFEIINDEIKNRKGKKDE